MSHRTESEHFAAGILEVVTKAIGEGLPTVEVATILCILSKKIAETEMPADEVLVMVLCAIGSEHLVTTPHKGKYLQ